MELEWIASEEKRMIEQVEKLANICSGSGHIEGIERVIDKLKAPFSELGDCSIIPLPPKETLNQRGEPEQTDVGSALHITCRKEAPIQVFLGAHLDTVFSKDSPFQKCEWEDDTTLRGPGVSDIKGGIVILLTALQALHRMGIDQIGWEVLLNPDEEIGSTSSYDLLKECGKRCHVGLVFEPSLPDGTMISERKGSANGIALMYGVNAHVGREFDKGTNAIVALAELITKANEMNRVDGLTVNVGSIYGGGPLNVVPDFASCGINLRVENKDVFDWAQKQLQEYVQDGKWALQHYRPPKPFDKSTQALFAAIHKCGGKLGQPIQWQPSGGVCDGNILAEAGLPTIDTLGAIGGKIHTTEEYLKVDSLVPRAQLTTSFLMQLASGEIKLEEITHGHN